MALPTGTITMAQVNAELQRAPSAFIDLNWSAVRQLANRGASGYIDMNDLRGKSRIKHNCTITIGREAAFDDSKTSYPETRGYWQLRTASLSPTAIGGSNNSRILNSRAGGASGATIGIIQSTSISVLTVAIYDHWVPIDWFSKMEIFTSQGGTLQWSLSRGGSSGGIRTSAVDSAGNLRNITSWTWSIGLTVLPTSGTRYIEFS